jgi:hypothetical protein
MHLTRTSIGALRLRNQWIEPPARAEAATVVDHLVAVQSQDFAGAKWSLGLRLRRATQAQVEQAFNAGEILRTHVLRPTWHFVTPQDIRWLLALTGPRVQKQSAGPYRRAGLDAAVFRGAHAVLQRALHRGNFLTRDELRERLVAAGIAASHEFRLSYVLAHAELEGLICSGPRRGKQFTYALLDERAPSARTLGRPEALTELARRFFLSRGPATVHDLAKWSGLTIADSRSGLEAVASLLQKDSFDGQEYWFAGTASGRPAASSVAHLLPVYDEYRSSYLGHDAIAPREISARLRALGNALTGIMVIDGIVVGTWKRTLTREAAVFKLDAFGRLSGTQRAALRAEAERYARFHGLKAIVA